MEDAPGVDLGQSVRHVRHVPGRSHPVHRPLGAGLLGERPAVDVVHDQDRPGRGGEQVEDGDAIGMDLEGGHRPRLLGEPIRLSGHPLGGQVLERYQLVQRAVPGQPDTPEAAAAEQPEDLVPLHGNRKRPLGAA